MLLDRYAKFASACKDVALDFLITCVWRNEVAQAQLFNQGRTTPGPIVTCAQAGQSAHNVVDYKGAPASMAFDVAPLTHGKIDWSRNNWQWHKMGEIGAASGLEWAGNWTNFSEFPHFQVPNWRDVK